MERTLAYRMQTEAWGFDLAMGPAGDSKDADEEEEWGLDGVANS